MKSTYADLGSRVGNKHKTVEVTAAAAGGGIVFMLAGALLSGAVVPEVPVRALLATVVVSLAVAAAFAPAGGATNECHGIQSCIRVPGPWVVVPAHGTAQYLLTCPGGKSIVGGLDAQVTSRDVRVDFVGRLGAPVQPGATTTRYALFRAVSTSKRAQLFQPLLGCVPTTGRRRSLDGLGSRVAAGAVARVSVADRRDRAGDGALRSRRLQAVGAARRRVARDRVPHQAAPACLECRLREGDAGDRREEGRGDRHPPRDALSIDVHAIVQVGAECAP